LKFSIWSFASPESEALEGGAGLGEEVFVCLDTALEPGEGLTPVPLFCCTAFLAAERAAGFAGVFAGFLAFVKKSFFARNVFDSLSISREESRAAD
jgi:hypothetical protein